MSLTTDEKLLALSHDVIERFDKVDGGIHPGFRPAHAKGILLTGVFTPSPQAASLTRAPHVQRASTPVTVRFSNFAGIPTVPDNDPQGASPRGFAVRFHLAEHVHTDIVAHSVDAFPTRTVGEFLEFLNALIATDPAGPHPNAVEQFLGAHPAALTFVQTPKPIPTSFAKESFSPYPPSSSPMRAASAGVGALSRILPLAGNEYLDTAAAAARISLTRGGVVVGRAGHAGGAGQAPARAIRRRPPDLLFRGEIRRGPPRKPVIRFRIAVQLAEDGDTTNDATIRWPEGSPATRVWRDQPDRDRPGQRRGPAAPHL